MGVLVQDVLTVLGYATATAVSSPVAETAIVSSDVVNAAANPALQNVQDVNPPQVVRPVVIRATLNITAGTGTTAYAVRCRQGVGVGGAQVGATLTITATAAALSQFYFVFRDSSGAPFSGAGTAYTITVAQTGNTVAGTVNTADLEVWQ